MSTDSGDCESVDAVVRVDDEDDGDAVVNYIDSHCVEAVNGMATTARRLTVSLVGADSEAEIVDSGDCESVRLRLSTVAIARVLTRLSVLTTRIMVLVGYDNNTT